MSTFDSQPDDSYSLGQGANYGYSISHNHGYSTSVHISTHGVNEACEYCLSDGVSVSDVKVPDGDSDFGDVRRIAQTIFTEEVADVIKVLRNCGALNTKADSTWCLAELWRLLKPGSGNLT
jgi:hypothetical protein